MTRLPWRHQESSGAARSALLGSARLGSARPGPSRLPVGGGGGVGVTSSSSCNSTSNRLANSQTSKLSELQTLRLANSQNHKLSGIQTLRLANPHIATRTSKMINSPIFNSSKFDCENQCTSSASKHVTFANSMHHVCDGSSTSASVAECIPTIRNSSSRGSNIQCQRILIVDDAERSSEDSTARQDTRDTEVRLIETLD